MSNKPTFADGTVVTKEFLNDVPTMHVTSGGAALGGNADDDHITVYGWQTVGAGATVNIDTEHDWRDRMAFGFVALAPDATYYPGGAADDDVDGGGSAGIGTMAIFPVHVWFNGSGGASYASFPMHQTTTVTNYLTLQANSASPYQLQLISSGATAYYVIMMLIATGKTGKQT
jgi:hypothetical protein